LTDDADLTDDDIRAGEVALALADMPPGADAAFVARVEWWRDRFVAMIEPVEPRATTWPRIAAALGDHANDDDKAMPARVARGWRSAALAASAVAAALLAVVLLRPPVAPVPAPVLAQPLTARVAGTGGVALTVAYDTATARLIVTPVTLDVGARAAELWVIPEDGTPRSLGVIDATTPGARVVAPANRGHVHAGATFAVSLEPATGSPTGQPTGPVVATGKIVAV
jgi:anti-sigma-K factor RskA